MYQRALEVTHPHLLPGKISGVHKPLTARRRLRALIVRSHLILRRLGEFFAAGGAMS